MRVLSLNGLPPEPGVVAARAPPTIVSALPGNFRHVLCRELPTLSASELPKI